MPWQLVFDLVGMVVATMLTILSFNSMRVLKATGIKRSIMKPVLICGHMFIVGCVLSVVHDFMHLPILEILHHLSWTLALTVLTYGIYMYMKILSTA